MLDLSQVANTDKEIMNSKFIMNKIWITTPEKQQTKTKTCTKGNNSNTKIRTHDNDNNYNLVDNLQGHGEHFQVQQEKQGAEAWTSW